MSCSACKKKLKGSDRYLECGQCKDKYHTECLNINAGQFSSLSSEYRANWTCPICSNITKRTRSNINTPVRHNQVPVVDDSMNMSLDNIDRATVPQELFLPSNQPNQDNNLVTMDKISCLLDQKLNSTLSMYMENFRKMLKDDVKILVRAEMDATVKGLKDDFTTTTNFICDEQSTLKRELELKSQTIKTLEAENLRVQKDLSTLNNRLAAIEKMTRNQNLEIQAVPESRNENPIALFRSLCQTINLQLDDAQIHSCRRIAKINKDSNRPRNILVSLVNPRVRDQVLSACHRYNKLHKDNVLNTTNLGLPVERRAIYVNEHLSPECKALHAATRQTAKVYKYKFVWVKYGRVYVRKDESSGCILIKNMDDLNKLKLSS